MADTLKPCPFCGGNNIYPQNGTEHVPTNRFYTFIWCVECGAMSREYLDEAEAIAAWNRRAPSPDAAEIATLRAKMAGAEAAFVPDDAVVERVAKAIYEHWVNFPTCPTSDPWEIRREKLPGSAADFRAKARAALAAIKGDK